MSYGKGEYVVYGGTEICMISGLVNKSFDGISERSYYKLIPYGSENSSYYVPTEHIEERVRRLLTREEVCRIIDAMPQARELWNNNKNERKSLFGQALRSDDYEKLLGMMKALYNEQQKRLTAGKPLMSCDERALSAAQGLLEREFALVLGIGEGEVAGFIEKRLGAHAKEQQL